MDALSCTRLSLWCIVAVILQVFGLFVFIVGFFPVKPALSGASGPESYSFSSFACKEDASEKRQIRPPDDLKSLYKDMSQIPASFDRLIIMIIDSLPAEFILGRGNLPPDKIMKDAMQYTQSLLSNGGAIGYHAKAEPPTVTMPRLKAIVSGAIGGFMDVVFNFNTRELLDDNLIGQFASIGWKMVMLGDETWIKLFPGTFTRHDGVSSFFVKDTVEVDNNISRHLDLELASCDWNLLILHYLGLDHVGHLGGRQSILMAPKLREMDEIIRKIHIFLSLHEINTGEHTLLVVASDHGMTDGGNHGGSSYEETDALALFIGLDSRSPEYVYATRNRISQVDITPTLALLFGVPIPRNSVGVLIPEIFSHLTDGRLLRAMELNSWQLMVLLQAQRPDILCGSSGNESLIAADMGIISCNHTAVENIFCLFLKAMTFHNKWKFQRASNHLHAGSDILLDTIKAYDEFMRAASDWLSQQSTNKPSHLLACGIFFMLVSCLIFSSLLFQVCKQTVSVQNHGLLYLNGVQYRWHLDEVFIVVGVLLHVASLGASSMVEEEHYVWNFQTMSLFCLFLRASLQPLSGDISLESRTNMRCFHILCIIVVLICGRILRSWHQGGVNWTDLPDITKWLEHLDDNSVKLFQLASVYLVTCSGLYILHRMSSMRRPVILLQAGIIVCGLLVAFHVQFSSKLRCEETSVLQRISIILIMTAIGSALASPWIVPLPSFRACKISKPVLTASSGGRLAEYHMLRESSGFSSQMFLVCWCLLQLLFQRPVNSIPIFLLLLQFMASRECFSSDGFCHKTWVEVAAMYLLGMAGHFVLGNSNTLATIDVAGAYTGLSRHSIVLSGIILFIITYASPFLFLLGMALHISENTIKHLSGSRHSDLDDYLMIKLGAASIVPLALNSIELVGFTIILLLMRSHLFVWSVFSPKYLYVTATTICIYVVVLVTNVLGAYTYLICVLRSKLSGRR